MVVARPAAGLGGLMLVVLGACVEPDPLYLGPRGAVGQGASEGSSTPGSASGTTGASSDSAHSDGASDGGASESGDAMPPVREGPIGWASRPGPGLPDGTIGGVGGEVVVARTIDEFRAFVVDDVPRVVEIEGTLSGVATVSGSNKTIAGRPGSVIVGALEVVGMPGAEVRNVIIRDVVVTGGNCATTCPDLDALTVRYASHLWIDHCDLSDGDDGILDITRESDYVTVSWSRFHYSDRTKFERPSSLVGEGSPEDADHLRVTFHHDWWGDNIDDSMPYARFGQVHLFNNYYSATGSFECIHLGARADMRIEANVFADVAVPVAPGIDPTAVVAVIGNDASPEALEDFSVGAAFVPPYPYELDATELVADAVRSGAGPR